MRDISLYIIICVNKLYKLFFLSYIFKDMQSDKVIFNRLVTMKTPLKFFSLRIEARRLLQIYMSCEFIMWTILSYLAVYYGKIFDYRYTNPSEFASRIDTNFYYEFTFGHLNLTGLNVEEQQKIQGDFYLSQILSRHVILNVWCRFRKM